MDRSSESRLQKYAHIWAIIAGIVAVVTLIMALIGSGADGGERASPNHSSAHAPGSGSRSGANSTATDAPHEAVSKKPQYSFLTDMEPASSGGNFVDRRSAEIDGVEYAKSIVFYCNDIGEPAETPAAYNLRRATHMFEAVVGLESEWPSDFVVPVAIVGDGRTIATFTVKVGKAEKVRVDVTGVLRLELVCGGAREPDSRGTYNVAVAWGNARVDLASD